MTDTVQVKSYARKKPASILKIEALQKERLAQLQRENEAKAIRVLDHVPATAERKPGIIERFTSWLWRRG